MTPPEIALDDLATTDEARAAVVQDLEFRVS